MRQAVLEQHRRKVLLELRLLRQLDLFSLRLVSAADRSRDGSFCEKLGVCKDSLRHQDCSEDKRDNPEDPVREKNQEESIEPMFVGVDPSISNTGVVVLDSKGEVRGSFNSKHRKDKTKKSTAHQDLIRYEEIASFVAESVKASCGDVRPIIAYENYSFNSINYSFTLGELGGVLKLRLIQEFENLVLVEPLRVKKFATGLTGADKDKMITAAKQETVHFETLSRKAMTSDICDAYFLAKIAWYIGDPKSAAARDAGKNHVRTRLTLTKTILEDLSNVEQKNLSNNQVYARPGIRGRV